MKSRVELPALVPSGWPLAFLAATGAFRLLAEEGGHDRLRMRWPCEQWTGAVLEGGPWDSPGDVAAELGAIAAAARRAGDLIPGCGPGFPLVKRGLKGADPARPRLGEWSAVYGQVSNPQRTWRDSLVIPDPRGLVWQAVTHAAGPVLLPEAAGEQARLLLGPGHRVPDAALWSAASWLAGRGAIKPVPAGVPRLFTVGRKSALTPHLRERICQPFLSPYLAPVGQQTTASFFAGPLQAVQASPALLAEALTSWRWHDGITTGGLDYRGFTDAAAAPDGRAAHRAPPGAVWLAGMALPLDPLRAEPSGMVCTGLWQPRGDGLMVMSMPVWDQPLTVGDVRALFASGGRAAGAGVWRTDTAIRMCPPGNKRSRGMLTSADLDSPLWLSLPDLEWRIAPWWASSPAGFPALAASPARL